MCKTYHWERVGGVYYSLWSRREKNFTYFHIHKKWMPRSTPRGWAELQMTGLVQWSVFQVMQKWQTKFRSVFQRDAKTRNEIQIRFQSNAETKNAIHIRFSKWCENEKQKLKLVSVFQSDAKAKNEIRSSKPFFKVRRKRKTKSKIQICFSMSCENEKWMWHLNSFFPCHRKTVGTKVHAFRRHARFKKFEFLFISPEDPFGKLFSKTVTIFKSSSEAPFLPKNRKV